LGVPKAHLHCIGSYLLYRRWSNGHTCLFSTYTAFLSAWATIFVFQNIKAESRGASWSSIAQFVLSGGFCGLIAASPREMGIGFGFWAILYFTFVSVSVAWNWTVNAEIKDQVAAAALTFKFESSSVAVAETSTPALPQAS
jgi:hypothetical protein